MIENANPYGKIRRFQAKSPQARAWALVDLDALRCNYRLLTHGLQEGARPIAVLKANAYGHGALPCAQVLWEAGCDRFAVATLEEGEELSSFLHRQRARAEILILGYTPPNCAHRLCRSRLTQTLLSPSYALELNRSAARLGARISCHVALDTGMNRIGICARHPAELPRAAEELAQLMRLPHLRVTGTFTHFSMASSPDGEMFTNQQVAQFLALRQILEKKGLPLPFCHLCNSSATLLGRAPHADGVRLGIALFGAGGDFSRALPLRPVMRLQARIVHLHPVSPGDPVGYDGAWVTRRKGQIATLSIGYADGLLRGYGGAPVTVHTQKGDRTAPLVGRICMDQCMADVTGLEARVGDVVTFFGQSPSTLAQYAARAGTIDYESLCLLSSRVKRIYVKKRRKTNR